MNRVSIPATRRFIWACCSSASASEATRRPLMITSAPISRARSTTRLRNDASVHVGQMGHRVGDHLLALFQGEERLALLGVAHGRHHDVIEEL